MSPVSLCNAGIRINLTSCYWCTFPSSTFYIIIVIQSIWCTTVWVNNIQKQLNFISRMHTLLDSRLTAIAADQCVFISTGSILFNGLRFHEQKVNHFCFCITVEKYHSVKPWRLDASLIFTLFSVYLSKNYNQPVNLHECITTCRHLSRFIFPNPGWIFYIIEPHLMIYM